MVSRRRYHLKQHHKFEQGDRKYVADLETGDIVEINDVEWEILSRYASQPRYQLVECLRKEYKLTAIFDGIERLERLGRQGFPVPPGGRGRRSESPQKKFAEPAHATCPRNTRCRESEAEGVGSVPFYEGAVDVGLPHESEPLSIFDAPCGVRRVRNVCFSWRREGSGSRSRHRSGSEHRWREGECLDAGVVCHGWL